MIRELGEIEKLIFYVSKSFSENFVICYEFQTSIKQIDAEIIKRYAELICKDEIYLKSKIIEKKQRLYFEYQEKKTKISTKEVYDKKIEEIINEELSNKIDCEEGLLPRIILHYSTNVSLLVIFNHIISDGVLASRFVNRLLAHIKEEIIPSGKGKTSFSDSLEDRMFGILTKSKFINMEQNNNEYFKYFVRQEIFYANLNKKETKAIRYKSKLLSVSNNSILSTVLISVFKQLILNELGNNNIKFRCLFPVNLKRFLFNNESNEFGYYLSRLNFSFITNQNFDINFAVSFDQMIREKLFKKQYQCFSKSIITLLKYWENNRAVDLSIIGSSVPTVMISNIGSIETPLPVDSIYTFFDSNSLLLGKFSLSVSIAELKDAICLSVHFPSGSNFSKEFFIKKFEDEMLKIHNAC